VKVGILGAGQLGRMIALAGHDLGLTFRFFDQSDGPAGQVAELVQGEFADTAALDRFCDGLDCATFEFENVPVSAVERIASRIPTFPPPAALGAAQDRLTEKSLFARLGIPTPAFAPIDSADGVAAAIEHVGLPAVVKTRRMGYDGKGQAVVRQAADLDGLWLRLGGVPLIAEAFVPFQRELSILAVRSRTGATAFYPLVQNTHRDGILRLSIAPAPEVPDQLQRTAETYAAAVMSATDYVGVLAIEWFEVGGTLMANEMAPRVHNSGHWTIEGSECSQFENHLRAVLGWPLGSTSCRGHSAMVNLIGTMPDRDAVLAIPGAHLHDYGKQPRAGRKLGHVTIRADSAADVQAAQRRLDKAAGFGR
jgi:5-(carboxyamino)imidazole ribonucleotide synthase